MEKQSFIQDQFVDALWRMCQSFAPLNLIAHQNLCLALLFVKYSSDLWKSEYRKNKLRFGDDIRMVQRKMNRLRFQLPDSGAFDYLYKYRHDSNLGEQMDKILSALEELNPEKLRGIFQSVSFNSESLGETRDRNRKLKKFLTDLSNPAFNFVEGSCSIGLACQNLLERFSKLPDQDHENSYTPPEISELLAILISPRAGSRIYDPACGTGSLLATMSRYVKDGNENQSDNFALYGQELKKDIWVQAKLAMFLNGLDATRLACGDTLARPAFMENDTLMKYEAIVSSSPLTVESWDHRVAEKDRFNRFGRGIPPKTKGDYAFILHMIESAAPNGRIGTVVSHGVLFRAGTEAKIRRALIEENLLDAVICLPANLFPRTSIPTVILMFSKVRSRQEVLFIDARDEYQQGKKQAVLRGRDILKISNTYRSFEAVHGYSRKVSPDEIRRNDFNLSISRYISKRTSVYATDIQTTRQELTLLEQELEYVRKALNAQLGEVGMISL